jgi:hypothetical protein
MPFLRHLERSVRLTLAVAALTAVAGAGVARAQDGGGGAFGIRAIGAAGLHAGGARVERGADAFEVGGRLDIGHFPGRRVRVVADVAFLRTLPYEEFVAEEEATYRDVFYDLSGHVMLQWMLVDPSHRVVPYATTGVGVHALTSSFGSIIIDQRYNSNNFGLRGSAGLRVRVGSRRALMAEYAGVLARNVSRGTVLIGLEWLFGDQTQTRR